ncbi:MAG: poly-gamma-glutamate synthase PgsB, partial [Chloroflexi bacterium]|nr:poly-gamma-glutamate synthase PgsB [Chloroflexota bacterium]
MFSLLIVIVIVSAQLLYWNRAKRAHQRRIDQLSIRVHVNGIRGKSTVTRLIAGVLRAGGYNTFAKTTGSAARIIHPDGSEDPIHRYGAATILEQINIVKAHVTPNTEAMVMECMAVNPAYQHVAQHEIVQGNITVITNVREDHQAQMGETLPEIAHALATTIPRNGLL